MDANHADPPAGERRRGRAGLEDVARLAGVSPATVDRVLNERGNVAPATARRVIEAAKALDLRRVLPRPYSRRLRFEALLARPDMPFLDRLNRGFTGVAATLDRSVIIQRTSLPTAEPVQVAERLRTCRADGLILYGEEHPAIVAAIAEVAQAGTPVVSLVTDIAGSARLAYVGIDNTKAGRTAGFLTARMARRPGSVVVLTNRLAYRAHAERVNGFHDGLARHAPDLRLAAVVEGYDEEDRTGRLLGRAFDDSPDIVAIYNSGGINTVVAALIRRKRMAGRLVFVGYELNAATAALLQEGVMTLTIDQALEHQAQRAIEVLLHRFGHLEGLPAATEVPFTLHTRENT